MTDGRELLRRYLEQRELLGEGPLVLDRPGALLPAAGSPPARVLRSPPTSPSPSTPPVPRAPPPRDRPRPRASRGERGSSDWRRGAPDIPSQGIVIQSPTQDLFTENGLAALDLDGVGGMVTECRACSLCEGRTNAVPGEGPGDARLVVVGEGPGAKEDETGRPFVGRAGELLTDILRAVDLPREQVFICNIVKCRPPGNRKPLQEEIEACVPYLYRQLEIIRPRVILAMGGTAAETLLNTKQSLGSLRNSVHTFRGIPLVVTYHPAALLRNPNWKKPTWDDVRIARQLVDR